jgi:hypothetical protein
MPLLPDHSVLIMITATSMLSGTGAVSALTGSGGEAGSQCDSPACFASKVRTAGLQRTTNEQAAACLAESKAAQDYVSGSAG